MSSIRKCETLQASWDALPVYNCCCCLLPKQQSQRGHEQISFLCGLILTPPIIPAYSRASGATRGLGLSRGDCTHLLNICSAVICEQGHQHQPASKPAVLICGASCHPANRKHSPASQHRDHPHCTPTHAEADENGQIATAGRRRVRKTPKTAEVEVEAETLKMLSNENWPMSRALALVITEYKSLTK